MGIPIDAIDGFTLDANNSMVLMSYVSKVGRIVDLYQ
jgi:hypothetical protein